MRIIFSLAAILVALGAPVASASTLAPAVDDGGFHLSLGFVGQSLDLRDGASRALSRAGIALDRVGTGAELVAGYRFGSRLSLNFRISGGEHDTGRNDVTAGVGLASLELVGHMRPGERVQPYLLGGFAGGGIVLEPKRGDSVTLEGSGITAGAGVDFLIGNRWTLGFAYRGALLDYDRATIALAGRTPVEFRGSGVAHELGFRWELRI